MNTADQCDDRGRAIRATYAHALSATYAYAYALSNAACSQPTAITGVRQ